MSRLIPHKATLVSLAQKGGDDVVVVLIVIVVVIVVIYLVDEVCVYGRLYFIHKAGRGLLLPMLLMVQMRRWYESRHEISDVS